MDDNKFMKIDGSLISIAEEESDPSRKVAKFLLCPLDEANANLKGIKESDLSEDEMKTLIGQPLVTKVIFDENTKQYNFSGHLMQKKWKYDQSGNLVKFSDFTSTNPIGYHTSISIEDIEFGDVTKRCLVAEVVLWTRYYRAMEVIERLGTDLHTSWEVSYGGKYIEDGIEWLTDILFLANCVLGSNINPAYSDAGLLECAEENNNQEDELGQALIDDIKEIRESENNDQVLEQDNTEISIQSDENSVDDKLNENIEGGHKIMANEKKENIETSALNTDDLRSKVVSAVYATESMNRYYYGVIVYPYDYVAYAKLSNQDSVSDDFTKFTFVINSDDSISLTSQEDVKMTFTPKMQSETEVAELQAQIDAVNVTLSEKETELSTKIDEIVKLGETITSQQETIAEKDKAIAELEPIRLQMEQAEAEKKEAEIAEQKENLKKMALSSKYFTEEEIETSEELKKAIEEIDEKQIKCLIAERVVEQASKIETPEQKETIVSETKEKEIEVSTDLSTNYEYETSSNALLSYARRNIKK